MNVANFFIYQANYIWTPRKIYVIFNEIVAITLNYDSQNANTIMVSLVAIANVLGISSH